MTRAMSQEPTAGGGVAEAPADHDESAQEGFDWSSAERDLGDVVHPMFADGSTDDGDGASPRAFDVEREQVRLADVGGLDDVKARLEASFLAPLRNPELRTLYGKSLGALVSLFRGR